MLTTARNQKTILHGDVPSCETRRCWFEYELMDGKWSWFSVFRLDFKTRGGEDFRISRNRPPFRNNRSAEDQRFVPWWAFTEQICFEIANWGCKHRRNKALFHAGRVSLGTLGNRYRYRTAGQNQSVPGDSIEEKLRKAKKSLVRQPRFLLGITGKRDSRESARNRFIGHKLQPPTNTTTTITPSTATCHPFHMFRDLHSFSNHTRRLPLMIEYRSCLHTRPWIRCSELV